jgi:raffinose/stachyose/melibiose transport system permease protein/N-acetylglucosamine transport system permease protein
MEQKNMKETKMQNIFSLFKEWRKNNKEVKKVNNDIESKELRTPFQRIIMIVVFIIFLVYSITLIYPFIYIFLNSLKTTDDFFGNFNGLPIKWMFSNYSYALVNSTVKGYNILQMMGISILLTFGGTIATVFTSSISSYVMAKYNFKGKNVIYSVVIFSLIVPIVGTLPSMLILLRDYLGIYDTPIAIIFLYSGGFGMNFLLLYSSFKGISWEYAEAALVDGATDFQIFFKVMLPLAKGSLIAIGIITLIGLWNDYTNPALFLPSMPSLAVGMESLVKNLKNSSKYPQMFASAIIAMMPILIIFSFFSNTIMKNTSVGGLKG